MSAPRALALCAVLCAALLAGCKQELYASLSEDEANQMLAVLMAHSIATDKTAEGKDGFMLSVDQSDMLRAIAALKDAGYPKAKRQSIADIFQPSGLMPSPFEERVRYVYALGQEVAQTLSRIDGVVSASVHVVLPDPPQIGQPMKPSSAAVFIKYEPGVDLDYFVPQIKRLVSSSIEGLDYSAVTVVLAEATPMRDQPIDDKGATIEVLPGVAVAGPDEGRFWQWTVGSLALTAALVISNLTLLVLWRGKTLFGRNKETAAAPIIEPT